jgi:hypothetical protein
VHIDSARRSRTRAAGQIDHAPARHEELISSRAGWRTAEMRRRETSLPSAPGSRTALLPNSSRSLCIRATGRRSLSFGPEFLLLDRPHLFRRHPHAASPLASFQSAIDAPLSSHHGPDPRRHTSQRHPFLFCFHYYQIPLNHTLFRPFIESTRPLSAHLTLFILSLHPSPAAPFPLHFSPLTTCAITRAITRGGATGATHFARLRDSACPRACLRGRLAGCLV